VHQSRFFRQQIRHRLTLSLSPRLSWRQMRSTAPCSMNQWTCNMRKSRRRSPCSRLVQQTVHPRHQLMQTAAAWQTDGIRRLMGMPQPCL
jgi:hypothetical protein